MSASLLLQLVLTGTQTHYETRGLIDDKRLEHLLIAGKQILYKSHQESDVRTQLGFNPRIWEGLSKVLTVAIPVLEQQSFSYKNPPNQSYGGSSSELIAAHYPSLVKDIERLNDLCTIARNLLATTKKAQNLAADKAFDQQILKLIDVCVKVTARGFDGEANPRNEERWQKVVNLYKRLLITCLQFLHNFIMHNEQRKLVLWLDLFGQSQVQETDDQTTQAPEHTVEDEQKDQPAIEDKAKSTVANLPDRLGQLTAVGGGYNIDDVHALFDLMSANKEPDEQTQKAAKVLMDKIRSDMENLSGMNANQLDDNPDALLKVGAALRAWLEKTGDSATTVTRSTRSTQVKQVAEKIMALTRGNLTRRNGHPSPTSWTNLPEPGSHGDISEFTQALTEEDSSMPRTAQSAAATLQEAKDELMARLHEAPILDENGEPEYDDEGDPEDEEDLEDEDDLLSVVDSMEDEDYHGSGDQERGLLTDVPLVLGPTEIEALPMIIQAGIVDNFGSKTAIAAQQQSLKANMQAVRCHILLAQEAGRNVLRELLIFIAAWDLPDDEFYFKMMVQIMEAILKNGLMSHAYSDFGQPKDIISPAQAVVIKILTHIFRAKYSPASVVQQQQKSANEQLPVAQPGKLQLVPSPLSRVDVLTVRYIFIVFRGNIIPETCALIYLQGQIRAGLALAEDFPLNLWDMERVYEGVYQFLEFFAVLTENNDWKKLLVQWEIVYDLVTLIKELDQSIAKVGLTQGVPARTTNGQKMSSLPGLTPLEDEASTLPAHVAVERPYDTAAQQASQQNGASPASDPLPPQPTPSAATSPQPAPATVTEEPADFEWRNLKKLIILVLSSLVWKSPSVQNQIREYGGVETILSCTTYDACNPYIKEHAVMCLKFLLENNPENQALVSSLEAREVVPPPDAGDALSIRETMDKMGVDVRLGNDGRARVVRKEGYGGGRMGLRNGAGSAQSRIEELRDEVEALGLPVDGEESVDMDKRKGKERAVEFSGEDDDGELEFM